MWTILFGFYLMSDCQNCGNKPCNAQWCLIMHIYACSVNRTEHIVVSCKLYLCCHGFYYCKPFVWTFEMADCCLLYEITLQIGIPDAYFIFSQYHVATTSIFFAAIDTYWVLSSFFKQSAMFLKILEEIRTHLQTLQIWDNMIHTLWE